MDACGCCRGYIKKSWNLIDVEAGFELWRGGAGLTWHVFTHHRRCCPVGRKASRQQVLPSVPLNGSGPRAAQAPP
jgi:hypothetical protein